MLILSPLTPFLVLATRVVAGSTADVDNFISIDITKRISSARALNVVQKDNMRSRFLLEGGQQHGSLSPPVNVPLNEISTDFYTADIAVGNPPTHCESC